MDRAWWPHTIIQNGTASECGIAQPRGRGFAGLRILARPPLRARPMSSDNVYRHFYRIMRPGASELSDGGGPFGFDITTALEFDFLIERYGCDAVIEAGCNVGDTTEYLARAYRRLQGRPAYVIKK